MLDAGGSPTDRVEEIAGQRLLQAGIPVTSTNAVVTELIKVCHWLSAAPEIQIADSLLQDWSTEAGQMAFPLLA